MSDEKDIARIVIVTAQHGEKYLGHIPAEVPDPIAYVRDKAADGKPIMLEEVLLLASQLQTETDARGAIKSVGRFNLLVSVDLVEGALSKLNVIPSAWYFISENPGSEKVLDELIQVSKRNAEEAARVSSAIKAGIELPNRGR